MVPREFNIDFVALADYLIEDCPEEVKSVNIDGMLEHFGDNIDFYLMKLGFPSEALEGLDDYIYDQIYDNIYGDLSTTLDNMLDVE